MSASHGVLWDKFVAAGVLDSEALAAAIERSARSFGPDEGAMGHLAFRIGMSSLLIGAEDVGRLALATESLLDRAASEALDDATWTALRDGVLTLRDAFLQLANPDKSGARVEDLPLAERVAALASHAPVAGKVAAPKRFVPPPVATENDEGGPSVFRWVPAVDEDMIDLFFDEAGERVEALAGKLVEIERRPDDVDLLRDVFRDMHTVKGSSAMVGLIPVNQLAHAAEDLVGQIRDAGRAADGPVVDALLAALDTLRDMLAQARSRGPITIDPSPVVSRLRNPGAPVAAMPRIFTAAATSASTPTVSADPARATIRVDFDKLDRLLNLVGELVLGRDELRHAVDSLAAVASELAADRGVVRKVANARRSSTQQTLATLTEELSRVERVLGDLTGELDRGTDRLDAISDELREEVMRLRMVPVAGVFRKHVRTVRDLSANLNKRARLELVGDDTELDKLLVEAVDEPLMHLVRNAVDHGLEGPDARVAAGKPAEGVIRLIAQHRGNQVEIRVTDDGKGLDPAKLKAKAVEKGVITAAEADHMDEQDARMLIFRAGFSTAAQVSEVSGRGVGMDVVRNTIIQKLKGSIDVESEVGKGSAFVLKLPLTLAIIQVLVARAGGETFAIPLDLVKRVIAIKPKDIELIGDREVCVVREKHVPVIRLEHVLELDDNTDASDLQLVLVEHAGSFYALVSDQLLGKREIVIKSLGRLLTNVPCVAGATLLGDRVALILDIPAIITRALAQPSARTRVRKVAAAASTGAHVLVVEDGDIVRESLRRLLVDAGYVVTVAVDGQHGLELAKQKHFDLVSTDVVMPRMDGYELTRALRALPEYAETPIVMVTSMGERIDRVRGFDAGVDEYITKPHDRTLFLKAVRKLLGHVQGDGGSK
ncbi:MAG TPA: response regulator [Kofleriaceae bacterium]